MKRQTGFTLIEIMIVVAIIAILASIGIPTYQNTTRKAHRSDAQQLMMDIANKQQQYLMDARQYASTLSPLSISKDGWTCGATCTSNFYTVAIDSVSNTATPPTFTVKATAKASQLSDGDMTLDSTGSKSSTKNHDGWGG